MALMCQSTSGFKNEWTDLLMDAFSPGNLLSRKESYQTNQELSHGYARHPQRLNGHTLFCFIMLNFGSNNLMEIIAEIGQNHNGDLNLAKEMIHAAKENGAEVAKFQLFDAKALFPKENNPWYRNNLNAELSREETESLYEHCTENGH